MGYIRYDLSAFEKNMISARLLYVTASYYDNDWPSILHSHYFAECFYVIDGEGEFVIEGTALPVKANDLIMINPHVSHTERSVGHPLDYIVLGVEGIVFAFDSQQNQNSTVIDCRQHAAVFQPILQMLLTESEQKRDGYIGVCNNYFHIFMAHLNRISQLGISLSAPDRILPECSKVKSFIDANLSKNITLDTLADIAHLNKYYLSHSFMKAYGISPINYLIDQRMRRAKELLESTDHSIAQVTQGTGFSSQSYFTQCFKKHTGLTPVAYRKKATEAKRNELPGGTPPLL